MTCNQPHRRYDTAPASSVGICARTLCIADTLCRENNSSLQGPDFGDFRKSYDELMKKSDLRKIYDEHVIIKEIFYKNLTKNVGQSYAKLMENLQVSYENVNSR